MAESGRRAAQLGGSAGEVGSRPVKYDASLIDEILKRLAAGETLRQICRRTGMPRESTFRGWVLNNVNGLGERYARARDLGLDSMVDEMLEIADDTSNDTVLT